jgi:hypothetical protein
MTLPPRQKVALASGNTASLGSQGARQQLEPDYLPLELRVQFLEATVKQLAQSLAHVHGLGDALRVENDGTVTLRKKLFIAPGADIEARD